MFSIRNRGGQVAPWCWVYFQCRGVLLSWIRVGQGSTTLAVDAGGVVCKVGKKAGNTHISQDGGKYW